MFALGLVLFTMSAETNLPGSVAIKSMLFGSAPIVLDWWSVVVYAFVFLLALVAINRMCYDLIFRLKLSAPFRNNIGLLVAMTLKYVLPMTLLIILDINGKSVMLNMPVTYFFYRVFMGLSMLYDLLAYTFQYNDESVIATRIGKRHFTHPCKKVHYYLTILLWTNFFTSLAMAYKHIYQSEKQPTRRE